MKNALIYLVFTCCFATVGYSQVGIGITYGISFYRWDQNPNTNSPELKSSSGSIGSTIGGVNFIAGGSGFRFMLDAYGDYAPYAFDVNQFKGMGTLSYGAMAKFSVTPWETSKGMHGFSLGYGIEGTQTEMYFTPKKYQDMVRDWYWIPYGYIAYSMFEAGDQIDLFFKFGANKDAAMTLALGVKYHVNLLGF